MDKYTQSLSVKRFLRLAAVRNQGPSNDAIATSKIPDSEGWIENLVVSGYAAGTKAKQSATDLAIEWRRT